MTGMSGAVWLAVAALVPIVVLMMTSFVKISVVLSLLRNALGAPDAPSGLVVMGLSLILTFFVMAPVGVDMLRAASETPVERSEQGTSAGAEKGAETRGATHDVDAAVRALVPVEFRGQIDAVMRGLGPLRGFLAKHAAPRDRETFVALAKKMGNAVRGDELWVLAPAFVATELREAFAIAVLIFVPFLVIDLLVGLGLAALGLGATSPQVVALPMKLLLFVGVDGWRLLLDALLRGYA